MKMIFFKNDKHVHILKWVESIIWKHIHACKRAGKKALQARRVRNLPKIVKVLCLK